MRNNGRSNTVILAGVFAVFVLFLIGASLAVKLLGILAQSSFDGQHRFTVLLSDSSGNVVYLSSDPVQKSSTKLVIENSASRGETRALLPVAVDGEVVLSTEINTEETATGLIRDMLVKKNNVRKDVTGVDLIRMYWASKTVESEKKFEEEISVKDALDMNDTLVKFFSDGEIENEDKTIAIENGSHLSGVATRLENVLSVLGANVISVETSSVATPSSYITFYEEPSYTSRKIERLLKYPSSVSDSISIADISIIIGEDGFDNSVFAK